METIFKDLKHSLRMLRQSPAFTLTAIAALALGIGANTAIFSIVNTVLLKPVPFPEPDRLVMLMNMESGQLQGPAASPAKFAHYRQQSSVIEQVSAFRFGALNYTGGDIAEQLRSAQVSVDYFRCFGAPIIQGRSFSTEEDLPHGANVALLSQVLWKRRFGSDPQILGKTIQLGAEPFVVIGIVGDTFDLEEFGPQPEVWTPFQLDPNTSDQGHYFQVAARLKPGVTFEQAKARLQVSGQDFRAKFPQSDANQTFTVERFQEAFVRDVRSSLMVLEAAVSFVLLIACANVASLLLVRATGRKREIAIRSAIGAGRGRIIRQLLTESVLLSLIGGAIGLLLGVGGIRALLSVNTADLPRAGSNGALVRLDWRVAAFALAVSIGSGILFGLIPAFQGSRADLSATLKEGGGRSGTGLRQNKVRSLLVIWEVALALVLLVGSALLIRTSMALGAVEPGFDTANVLTLRMSLSGSRFQKSMGVEQMVRDGVERLRNIPGVAAASSTCCVPLEDGYGLPFTIVGRPLDAGKTEHGDGGWLTVSPGYFDVFKIPVKRGRVFNEHDDATGLPAVVINEAMARQFWKDSDPLQDRLVIGRGVMHEFADEPDRQIIGVVGNVRDGGLNSEPGPTMYIVQGQVPDPVNALNLRLTPLAWVVRTQGKPRGLVGPIQEAIRQASGLPVTDIKAMDQIVGDSVSRQRFNMLVMTFFGFSALLLAAIGIYGLMAYSVQQRTQEIGIRLALGAETSQVKNMIVLQGMRLVLAGIVIGLAGAFGLTRFISSFLFGVKERDPIVFAAVPVLLAAIAFLAVWLPARRASRVDPMDALRTE